MLDSLIPLHRRPNPRHRRAAAFIATVWIMAALAALTLVLAHSVRVETLASANRLAIAQADAAERGAEQFALSAVDMEIASPGSVTNSDSGVSMEAISIGNAYVWFIRPDPDDETAIDFGLTDEAGKLDVNHAVSNQLASLPNMTRENADCILDWRTPYETQSPEGAKDSWYLSRPVPYHCKNGPYETLEELMLVKSIAADDAGNPTNLLFGLDTTRSGHVDPANNSFAANLQFGQSVSNRGIAPFLTVYGVQAATVPPATATTEEPADLNTPDSPAFKKVLQQYLAGDAQRIEPLMQGNVFASVWDWAFTVKLNAGQLSQVITHVQAIIPGAPPVAKINVNTAPPQVLMCLPYFTQADADAIVAHRRSNPNPINPADISWLLAILPEQTLRIAGSLITGTSSCYSADIVAVSASGRAFKRVRIVIDASTGTSKIIYRRDLTTCGWPLDPTLRTALQSGRRPPL